MEFERLTYRIYKHCLDSFRDNGANSSKSCWILSIAMLTFGIIFLCGLLWLHSKFVSSPVCHIGLLSSNGLPMNESSVCFDCILNITVSEYRMSSKSRLSSLNYQFAFDAAVLALPDVARSEHNFETLNGVLVSSCFENSITNYLLTGTGYDSIVINWLMRTFKQAGILQTPDGEYFIWDNNDVHPYRTSLQWSNWKFNILTSSLLSFFLTSSVCAMVLRAYLSSVLYAVYPIYFMTGLTDEVYNRDHPMLGAQINLMRSRNQSVVPFIIAHITRVILFVTLFVSAQYVIGLWLYRPSGSPGHPEFFVFLLVLFVEFLSLIFIRSRLSIQVFPRVFALMYLLFHFYYYSFPAGFHAQALNVLFNFTLAVFFYCLAAFETKACYRRVINRNHTRMLYNSLPWRSTVNDLSQDFTTFMPVTEYSRPTTTLFDILSRALLLDVVNNAINVGGSDAGGSETESGSFFSGDHSESGGDGDSHLDDSTAEIELTTPPLLSSPPMRNYGAVEYSAVRTVDEFGVPYLGLDSSSIHDRGNYV